MDYFPDLPGFDIEKGRASQFATTVQTSASGKELRATFMTGTPRFEYSLKLNAARRKSWADAPQDEILALLKCYNAARGKLNPLLIVDPVCGEIENVLCPPSTKSATTYQLYDDEGLPVSVVQSITALSIPGFVPPTSHPWVASPLKNAGYEYSGEAFGTAPIPIPVSAGDTVSLTTCGASACSPTETKFGPAGGARIDAAVGQTLPSFFAGKSADSSDFMACVGAFADAAGNVVQPVWIGPSATLTVPAGATRLLVGVNDALSYADNSGGYFVLVNGAPAHTWVAPEAELENALARFFPPDYEKGMLQFPEIPAGIAITWSGTIVRKVRFVDDTLSIKQIVKKLFSGDSIKLVSLK